ncbi:MAG: type IV secretory system conjugative DNA transfer family protein [Terriglobales bacterium]
MIRFFEQLIAAIWNRWQKRGRGEWSDGKGLNLGFRVLDGQTTNRPVTLTGTRRAMHLAVLGKTGTGKSSFLRHLAQQDIEADRGFAYFALHGDDAPFLLATINARERKLRRHLHEKLVLINPADPDISVGLNPLESAPPDFGRIAEFAQVLRWRWHLDHFGARTDELLRNALFVLSACGFTLVELAALLSHAGFRASCLKHVENPEVREYFELRYDQVSEAMRATMREPILNKTSTFTADPRFRAIVGQQRSTFSVLEAMDEGYWIILDLNKGRLGEQALTLGSLLFTMLKNAVFARAKRSLFTIYADEIQNFVSYDSGIETLLSESRKFGVGLAGGHQFLDQLSSETRAAMAAVGTHAYFQLSPNDAVQISQALDGGRPLAERIKNLRQRHAIVKTGSERLTEIRVPTVEYPKVDYTDLLNRARYQRGRVRAHIERDIALRHAELLRKPKEVLNDWE